MCLAAAAFPALQTHPSLTAPNPALLFLSSLLPKVHRSSLLHSPFYSTPAFASLSMISTLSSQLSLQCKCYKATSVERLRCSAPLGRAGAGAARADPLDPPSSKLSSCCVSRRTIVLWHAKPRRTTYYYGALEPLSRENLCSSLRQPQQLIYTLATLHS